MKRSSIAVGIWLAAATAWAETAPVASGPACDHEAGGLDCAWSKPQDAPRRGASLRAIFPGDVPPKSFAL